MTPLEMQFQIHLTWADFYIQQRNQPEVIRHMTAAENIIEELEAAQQPAPALGYWVLRKNNTGGAPVFCGQVGFCSEDSLLILKFETEDAALSYRKAVNMWKVLEPVQVLPPIEPLA